MDHSPKAKGGEEPLPEAVLWLLLTGELPNESEIGAFQTELFERGRLPKETEDLIKAFPKTMHPMT